ncbi:cysteine--tRNA ligase [Pseudohalioglobus sediminis]|uniref:Cysteine--tRNA ligase n=1 Tax=Pseudohalioglobus sediminis TaxID=2606449 RepID=A0A5B0X3P8_9GAMM|nr:cysteine--tRNA ligase [Pseudohalioglobus sediminis]KAA1193872.1 cysteine--tRNA ligase [Pseudohalioglobus sediminis]
MSLKVYNTMSGEKEVFEPLVPDTVTMYVCGPTVYNLAHIGNARPVVVFDTLFRLLQTQYANVTYARNITDVDDKIIAAAKASQRSIEAVTDEYTAKYREDMAALNALPPTLEPHATHNIDAMIELTSTLVSKGNAYESQGHVLFAVESMADYGKLSRRALDDMLAGARVEVADYKRHPGDFVLWKPAAEEDPGWDSPWGRGRPGWHLECSAMIRAHLGETIDIHGGGRDLIFPHHENEIAQSRCAHGGDYVRYWMHNAYLDIDGEKMSKSMGNFRTVRDLLQSYRGEVLRFALLSAHYRSPLNFSAELLEQAQATLDSLYSTLRDVQDIELDTEVRLAEEPFYNALNDDLNTPVAIAEIHALAHQLHKADAAEKPALKARILAAGNLLGILGQDPEAWLQGTSSEDAISADQIEAQIAARQEAKAAKDFARADEIRDALAAQGVILEDSREGTKWKRG